ncbi:barstar family protein [Ensifer adhaerens]|uniref:barstar family protein n=1 Tax=Ensifer adhaerens TaxID=106592 RepID=UPI0023A95497|nr:barstar family protein [Ensifer adhaerens]WDZ78559.1 barstar family protein [Ensifer adhaerens]
MPIVRFSHAYALRKVACAMVGKLTVVASSGHGRDMKKVVIDCTGIRSAAEFWQRYLDVAEPEGAGMFGCNLDAFWDALEGGGPGWPGDVALVFSNSDELSGLRTGKGNVPFLDALKTIASEVTTISVKLI